MEFNIANRMQGVKGSLIREILKMSADPNIIAFSGGNPSPDAFPKKEIAEIIQKVFAENPVSMLQYSYSEGHPPLRAAVADRLKTKMGIGRDFDDVIIVSGGQQAADLTAKALVNEGDTVICEDPSFVGCLNTFRSYSANLVGVPMDMDGINIEKLEKALSQNPAAKLIYLIPSFQNPTGITMSLEKRKAVYALARRFDVMILEDNPYGELRFSGEHVPAIKSMDEDGRVIYAGSFSKVMAPAFRLGFVCCHKELFGRMVVGKQCVDVHSNTLYQHVCAEFMTKYDFEGHLRRICGLYKEKCGLMLEQMDKNFHPAVRYARPEGGLFVMGFLPEGVDSYPFVVEGIKRGVAAVPGAAFLVDQTKASNGFRLNYSSSLPDKIVEGIGILGKLSHEYLGAK
jgi:2-aminoadipate transaminase